MKEGKADLLLWILTTFIILVLMILHPRFHYALMFLYSFYKSVKAVREKKVDEQSEVKKDIDAEHETKEIKQDREIELRKHNTNQEEWQFTQNEINLYHAFGHWIVMLAIGVLIGKAGLGWWWHAPYEYKADIRAIKNTDDRYSYFPDELPQGAQNVHWICRPGMLQGTSAKMLYFNTNAEYVQAIRERYENTARIYTYKKDDGMDVGYFEAEDGHDLWYGYLINSLSEEQRKRSVIYETYLTEGNHGRCGGILVDPVDNFVYYFFD
ncbi:MAG: hypothetical protein IJ833_05325 [Lachnospiraceae bacterium]|nr:hypothetical protein [Lachnospiraceae bacterium]